MKSKQYRKAVWNYVTASLLGLLLANVVPKAIATRNLFGSYQFVSNLSKYATDVARWPLRIDDCIYISQYIREIKSPDRETTFGCRTFANYVNNFTGQFVQVFVDRAEGTIGFTGVVVNSDHDFFFTDHKVVPVSWLRHPDRFVAQVDSAVGALSWLAMPPTSKNEPVKMYYQARLTTEMLPYQTLILGMVSLLLLVAVWCLYRNVRYVRMEKEKLTAAAKGIVNASARSPLLALIDDLRLTTSDFEAEVAEIMDMIRVMKAKDEAEAQQQERLRRTEAERLAEEAEVVRHFATELDEFTDRLIKASFPDGVYRKIMAHVRNAMREDYDLPTRRNSLGTATRLFENAARQRSLIDRLEMVRRDVPLQMISHSAYVAFVRHIEEAREGFNDPYYRANGVEYSLEQARKAADTLKVSVPITA